MHQCVVHLVFEIPPCRPQIHQEDAPCVVLQRVQQVVEVQASQCVCHSAMFHSEGVVAQVWFCLRRVVQLKHYDVL